MPKYPREITERSHATPEQMAVAQVGEWPVVRGAVVLCDHDPGWARRFAAERDTITAALGELVIGVEHVGSTSVPGLAAKPIIDIDLTIADTTTESGYVPALTAAGYRLVMRDPWWHQHRLMVAGTGDVHLHVWPDGAPETVRHRLFRDWLRTHPDDRERYEAAKRRIAAATAATPEDYNLAKNDVIDEIYARIFAQ